KRADPPRAPAPRVLEGPGVLADADPGKKRPHECGHYERGRVPDAGATAPVSASVAAAPTAGLLNRGLYGTVEGCKAGRQGRIGRTQAIVSWGIFPAVDTD